MFSKNDLDIMNISYFETIRESDSMYEIKSICTGHYWAIVPLKLNKRDVYYMLLHKYRLEDDYHHQTDFGTVLDAVLNIICHDDYKLKKDSHNFEKLLAKYS